MEQEILKYIGNYGVVAFLFYFFIKEFWAYMRNRKNNGKDSRQDVRLAVIETQLKEIRENHFPHIEKRLERIEEKVDGLLKK